MLWGGALLPLNALRESRGGLFPWVPVFIGTGIAFWFSLTFEPSLKHYTIIGVFATISLLLWWFGPELLQPVFAVFLSLFLGFLACGLRLWIVESPVLDFRYYGPVTGRVIDIDRSQSDALRITLDHVWLTRVSADRIPRKVRISLHSRERGHEPFPGEFVMVTARLSAPQGPLEPNTFDFRRMAYFDGIGALGYSQLPLLLWDEIGAGEKIIARMRSYLAASMMKYMPSQAGAFATGAMTGDRSYISQKTAQDLRDSSLAHLLAISGMNLAFLISFVFGMIRYGLALIPWVSLRVNTKKVAAVASFFVAAFYLALSGSNVATERAFIMVTVMLGAVMLDRKALTMRSIALAGVVILLWKPESLLSPGFQMSFAATAALIAGFREFDRYFAQKRLPRWIVPALTLFLSSLIGGLATAPYAAAHFNRFADYGLAANLVTGPVMGLVVMPAGALAALLGPFGLAEPALWVMEKGSAWILFVAQSVAEWDGSVTAIPSPEPGTLMLTTFAGAWFILWKGWVRYLAIVPACGVIILWSTIQRPPLLIAQDGMLVGLMGNEGRVLSEAKGAGFIARGWLENDGDLVSQQMAYSRSGMTGSKGERLFEISGVKGAALRGKKSLDRIADLCPQVDFIVISIKVEKPPDNCLVLDSATLEKSGALALYPQKQGILRVVKVEGAKRAWSDRELKRDTKTAPLTQLITARTKGDEHFFQSSLTK